MVILIENIQFFATFILLASSILYLITGVNFIFICVMLLNPYIAALLCFSKINLNYFVLNKGRFNLKNILVFIAFIAVLFIPYFDSTFSHRTANQLIQFLILSFIFIVLFSSGRPIIKKPDVLLRNLKYSCLILCIIKILSNFIGNADFYMFGKNEDAMLLIFGGVGSSLYFLLRKATWCATIDFAIYFYSISLYESRSALFFMVIIPFIIVFSSVYAGKEKFINKIYIFSFFFLTLLIGILSFELVVSSFDLNQKNNYSNLERLGMYFYTFDSILSGNYLGIGIGNLDLAMEEMYAKQYIFDIYPHPHSSFLRFSLELGLLGLFIYSAFIFYLLRVSFLTLTKDKCKGTLLLVFSTSVFYFSLFDSIFYSFFRGGFTLLILCTLISLKRQKI